MQHAPTPESTPADAADRVDPSVARRREILKRVGQGAVAAAVVAPLAASAGTVRRWRMDPSKSAHGGSFKLGVSS